MDCKFGFQKNDLSSICQVKRRAVTRLTGFRYLCAPKLGSMPKYINIESVKVPNPLAMKFETPSLLLTPGAYTFDRDKGDNQSPLAAKLFGFDYVERVFIAKNFVTVTKKEELPSWDELSAEVRIVIKRHLEEGAPIFGFDASAQPELPKLNDEFEEALRELVEGPVAQATWQDGGEITFDSYSDGVLKVKMAGACLGCPFAPRTLKHGVEVLVKRQFPEVKSVTSNDINWAETQEA
jgi:Fe-S cluster biogenesis protein NfuA